MADERIQRFANETGFAEEKTAYDADGFLRLPGLISAEHLAEIERNLATYMEAVAPALPAEDIVYEPTAPGAPTKIRNLWRMDRHSEFFAKLALSRELQDLLATLLNGEPVPIVDCTRPPAPVPAPPAPPEVPPAPAPLPLPNPPMPPPGVPCTRPLATPPSAAGAGARPGRA